MVCSRNIYFTTTLLSCLLGILITNITQDYILSGCLLFLGGSIISFISYYYRQLLPCLLFIVLGYSIGVASSLYYQGAIHKNVLLVDRYEGLYNTYMGEVKTLHKRSDFYDEYTIYLRQINDTQVSSDILNLLRIPKNFSLYPGQEISYAGKLYSIEDFDGFSYKKYMLSQNIYFSTSSTIVDTISENFGLRYEMFLLREKLLKRIGQIFPGDEAIFLGGILFGARENIPGDLKEDFNNSGLTHFIAVSGFNITLCVIFVTFLFGFLPMWGRIFTVSASIILFSIFVGLGAPVVRAAIMGTLGYIFLQSGKSHTNITLLAFTAVCMVIFSPLTLTYDVSLHLSFLAVIGIIYTQDFFKRAFFFVPEVFAIREAFVLTLAALSFALPIMIFQFGQVSLLAPFANIAVTWTIPLAMLGGAITLIIDIVSPTIGQFLGFITWLLLHYDIMMVRFFGNLEFALLHFDFGVYKNYLQALYFIILIYLVSLYQMRKSKQY